MENKRWQERVEIDSVIKFEKLDESGFKKEFTGRAINLSLSGLFFSSEVILNSGDFIDIQLNASPKENKWFNISGLILRSEFHEEKKIFHIVINFIDLNDKTEKLIIEFINRNKRN